MKRIILPYSPHSKEYARKLRKDMTHAERQLWERLRKGCMNGLDFDRQRRILRYIVDFYCKDLMLAIELDGSWHDGREEQDAIRQQALEAVGVRFLRFSNHRVAHDLGGVFQEISDWCMAEIKQRGYVGRVDPSPPTRVVAPPPVGGEAS